MRPEHKITYRDRMPDNLRPEPYPDWHPANRVSLVSTPSGQARVFLDRLDAAAQDLASHVQIIRSFPNGICVQVTHGVNEAGLFFGYDASDRQIKRAIIDALKIETIQRLNPRDIVPNSEAEQRIAATTRNNSNRQTLEERLAAVEARLDQITHEDGK